MGADDWDALYAAASDPLIWEQHPEHLRYTEPVFREFFRVALASGSALVAINLADGRVVGSSRYHDYNPESRTIEIGWSFLVRSHWGGRYNAEMKRLMLDHIFAFADEVHFVIGPQNIRSQQAIQRVGGTLLGTRVVRGAENIVFFLFAAIVCHVFAEH